MFFCIHDRHSTYTKYCRLETGQESIPVRPPAMGKFLGQVTHLFHQTSEYFSQGINKLTHLFWTSSVVLWCGQVKYLIHFGDGIAISETAQNVSGPVKTLYMSSQADYTGTDMKQLPQIHVQP